MQKCVAGMSDLLHRLLTVKLDLRSIDPTSNAMK